MRIPLLLSLLVVSLFSLLSYAQQDYYDILNVPRDVSTRQLRKAFRELSLKYHPDKNKDPEAADKFTQINRAYEVLKDDEKRRIYDQYGEEGLKEGGGGGHGHGFNPFESFFRGGGGGGDGREHGPTMSLPLEVTLEDLYNGKTLKVAHKRQVLCSHCRGTGTDNPNDLIKCQHCGGQGVRIVTQRMGPGFSFQSQQTCDKCGGRGTIAKSKCHKCRGTKVEQGEDILTIVVEKGMPNGHPITFSQQGDQSPDVVPGDLSFIIDTVPHSRFIRKGDNLHTQHRITLLEALVGFEHEITHLDGHTVKIARDRITIPHLIMKIPSEGMPLHETSSYFGNLFVEFVVVFPTSITEEQKEQFKVLLK